TLIGLDLNATRARAVVGAVEDVPELAALEPPRADLPLALSLEGEPAVGVAGPRLARRLPHLAQRGFLPELGQPKPSCGTVGRPCHKRLDGTSATVLALEHLFATLHPCKGVFCALPPYLSVAQASLLFGLSAEVGLAL